MKILIIDSSTQIIGRLAEILSEPKNKNTIHGAAFYEEASMLFKEIRPDVVVLDIDLPGGDSFEILREIKKSNQKTFVIILSFDYDKQIMEECISLGADFFFDKYYDFEKIAGVINTIGQAGGNADHP